MELSSLLIPVDYPDFKGIIKMGIEKDYHTLHLSLEAHQIIFDSGSPEMTRQIMDSINKKCFNDPMSAESIFNGIGTDLKQQKKFNYPELEQLDMDLSFADNLPLEGDSMEVDFSIFKVKLLPRHIKRLRRFVRAFLFNFSIINDTIRHFVKQQSGEVLKEKPKIVNQILKIKKEIMNVEVKEDSLMTRILQFSIKPQVTSYLIHLIMSYYQYYNDVTIKEENMKIYVPKIFTPGNTYNKSYMLGLFNSIINISLESATRIIQESIQFIEKNHTELSSIHLKTLTYVIFIAAMRLLYKNYYQWFLNNINKVVTNKIVQQNILNTHIKTVCPNTEISFVIINAFTEDFDDSVDEDIINQLSKNYDYLRGVSQEDFANIVFNKSDNPITHNEYIITSKTILDINMFIKSKINNNNILVDKNKYPVDYYLLQYNDGNIISKAYYHLLNYIKDPSTVLMINDTPQTVVKSFDILKDVLSDKYIKPDNISTYNYYIILKDILPNFKEIDFTHILYMIYQVIIPYQYDINNVSIFEDCFLNL